MASLAASVSSGGPERGAATNQPGVMTMFDTPRSAEDALRIAATAAAGCSATAAAVVCPVVLENTACARAGGARSHDR